MRKKLKINKVIEELEDLKNSANLVPLQNEAATLIGEDPDNITILSEDYEELDAPNKILEMYLRVLVSLLPSTEELCKKKTTEYNMRALTQLGDALRQTIAELEIYKDPNEIMEEKITPAIQLHHNEVIKKIAEHVSRMKTNLFELFPPDKQTQAQNLLIDFLKMLGEDLRTTYSNTKEKIQEDLLGVRGL